MAWTSVSFSAGDYTANGSMSWTVASGDAVTNEYELINRTMTWMLYVRETTVGGTLNSELRVAIPDSRRSEREISAPCWINENGTRSIGRMTASAGASYLTIRKTGSANWSTATDTTWIIGTIVFETTA